MINVLAMSHPIYLSLSRRICSRMCEKENNNRFGIRWREGGGGGLDVYDVPIYYRTRRLLSTLCPPDRDLTP
jgi:hypothetical protein